MPRASEPSALPCDRDWSMGHGLESWVPSDHSMRLPGKPSSRASCSGGGAVDADWRLSARTQQLASVACDLNVSLHWTSSGHLNPSPASLMPTCFPTVLPSGDGISTLPAVQAQALVSTLHPPLLPALTLHLTYQEVLSALPFQHGWCGPLPPISIAAAMLKLHYLSPGFLQQPPHWCPRCPPCPLPYLLSPVEWLE